jgi:NitT/TauT family transport system substrate-binding protein
VVTTRHFPIKNRKDGDRHESLADPRAGHLAVHAGRIRHGTGGRWRQQAHDHGRWRCTKIIYLPAKLTEQLGYFKDEGLDVEIQSQPAGVDAENELLAGAVQGVVGFYDHTIDLQSKGKEVEAVVVFGQVPGEAEMVATRAASQIRSMADIKGKTLGVTGLGSSTNFLTQYLAFRAGVTSSQFTVLPVGADATFIAAIRQAASTRA